MGGKAGTGQLPVGCSMGGSCEHVGYSLSNTQGVLCFVPVVV